MSVDNLTAQKKTVFITINRAYIARNLLFNNFFKLLTDKYRVVILTPLYQDAEFRAKFGQCEIEPLFIRQLSSFKKKLEQKFVSINRGLIYNPSSEVFAGFGRGTSWKGQLLKNGELVKYKRLRYFFAKYVFGKLLARQSVRTFFKFLDKILLPCTEYDGLIKKYQPSLVFVSALGADDEVMLLRNCKKRNIPSAGMAGSWDNLSKWGLREMVDILAVWSGYMKDEALLFQGYKEKQIAVVGIPQFDYYRDQNLLFSKEEFISKFKLDPAKKTIFFGSEGPICEDDPYVVSCLKKEIQNGRLAGYQILVRPHFSYKIDVDRFTPLVDNRTVFIDTFFESSNFKDGTALSLNTVKNLIAEIRYSDVAITSASTLVLDIIANGKQPILYAFDQDKNKPFKESTRRFYNSLWFKEIFKFGLDNVAGSEEELIEKIKEITVNPGKDLEKREKLLDRLCNKVDGDSGRRLFEVVDSFVKNIL